MCVGTGNYCTMLHSLEYMPSFMQCCHSEAQIFGTCTRKSSNLTTCVFYRLYGNIFLFPCSYNKDTYLSLQNRETFVQAVQAKKLFSRSQFVFCSLIFPLLSPAMIHPGFCLENQGNPIGLGQLTSWTPNILAKHQPDRLLCNRLPFHS